MTAEERITALLPLVQRRARWLRHTHYPNADPDDLAQDALVAILERQDEDSSFLENGNTDAYVITFGMWRAQDQEKRRRQHDRHIAGDLDAEGRELLALQGDLDLGLDLQAALAGLTETTRAIALGLAAGLKRREIADMLDMSPQMVSYRCKRIRRALAGAV